MAIDERDVDTVAAAPATPAKVGRLAGRSAGPLVVLSLVNLVDQTDTNILRGVLPFIEDEFNASDFQLGALGFAFVFINALATIPAGWLADRVRRTRLIGYTLFSWSGLSALSALAGGYVQLFAARASLGFGQAIDDPASTSLLADYYPAEVRGRVFSIQQVMNFIGGGLGLALGAFVGRGVRAGAGPSWSSACRARWSASSSSACVSPAGRGGGRRSPHGSPRRRSQ